MTSRLPSQSQSEHGDRASTRGATLSNPHPEADRPRNGRRISRRVVLGGAAGAAFTLGGLRPALAQTTAGSTQPGGRPAPEPSAAVPGPGAGAGPGSSGAIETRVA